MNPKHITPISKDRRAFAPYNFVELPDENKVVIAQELPKKNCYDIQRHTGYIQCTLVTESPLYIRCGLVPDDFKKFGDRTCNHEELNELILEEQKRWTDFFYNPANNLPVIPGSSLRGMIRTIIEIITYSKIHQVSGYEKLFFRAVATPSNDPLTDEYKRKLDDKVNAGYLQQQSDGKWRIYLAQTVEEQPIIWVKKSAIPSEIGLIDTNSPNYQPQHFKVRFDEINKEKTRYIANQVSINNTHHKYSGHLVTSGNMIEGNPEGKSSRQYHFLIGERTDDYVEIDPGAVEDYRAALTDFQKKYFDEENGILQNHYPVFFRKTKLGEKVTLFGHSPNFRVPYTPPTKNGRAASVTDFIPPKLKGSENPEIDMTEAIFGWVKDKKLENQAHAGRVFITDAILDSSTPNEQIWCQNNPDERITPSILATPKPTTFQHYLVQTDPDAKRENLKHYGSYPIKDTVIRGNKLYWHQKDVSSSSIRESNEEEIKNKPKQYTKNRPINSKVSFHFKIYFDNLTDEELGALLWVLDLAKEKESRIYVKDDQEYRFSLGMGKPFGMGAVKLTNQQLWLSQRQDKRYQKLFNGNKWQTGNYSDTEIEAQVFVESFKNYLLDKIGRNPDENLEDVQRIKMLLAMLSFPGKPKGSVRYMQIEHPRNNNEYDQRPVLPNPFDV
ncbi:MAG: TIGR03986 family CRISPR-associated RAMP protein [Nostoc sp.]|uniref:TIGR03986 family type III CRISPR-associated RAMP protein n=1 Tax=Nostoc sp. TaxID=1180 RepID=UPI002FFA7D5E